MTETTRLLGHERPAELADKPVGLCACDHRSYDHGRRKSPGSPTWDVTGCRAKLPNGRPCPCVKYENVDGTAWPYGVGP